MSDKKKIAIVIPCWKRSLILKYVMKQFDIFYQEVKDQVDILVIYVFSGNDPELKKNLLYYLQADHPRDYIYSSNDFLGQKLNHGIEHAMKYDFDYMMNCGSDDFIHSKIIALYQKKIEKGEKLFGVNKLYFYKETEDPLFFTDYNKPYVVGAGRMIHKDVIKHIFNEYSGLYTKEINRGMDTQSANLMHTLGYCEKRIDPGKFPYIIDIKSDVNINSFKRINDSDGATKRIQKADRYFLKRHFKLLEEYEYETGNLSKKEVIS